MRSSLSKKRRPSLSLKNLKNPPRPSREKSHPPRMTSKHPISMPSAPTIQGEISLAGIRSNQRYPMRQMLIIVREL